MRPRVLASSRPRFLVSLRCSFCIKGVGVCPHMYCVIYADTHTHTHSKKWLKIKVFEQKNVCVQYAQTFCTHWHTHTHHYTKHAFCIMFFNGLLIHFCYNLIM